MTIQVGNITADAERVSHQIITTRNLWNNFARWLVTNMYASTSWDQFVVLFNQYLFMTMRALTMMTQAMMTTAVMIKEMTQVDHPQAGHLNRLTLRLKRENPGADHRHHLEHNSNNNNNNNNRLEMFFSHSILVTIQEGHLRQVQVQYRWIHDLIA